MERDESTTEPSSSDMGVVGPSAEDEVNQQRVLEATERVRPRLHGYCARLLGSSLDGEDVVQDALARALTSQPPVASSEELEHWLFRVAHNRCTDLLRRRSVRSRADWHWVDPNHDRPVEPVDRAHRSEIVGGAFGRVVRLLPPKERAAVLLKDVLDFSLEETAEIIDSTVGGVKAALHRGRSKLATLPRSGASSSEGSKRQLEHENQDVRPTRDGVSPDDPAEVRLLHEYIDRFERRDWDGLISLVRSDARLEVVGVFEGDGVEHFHRLYFTNYSRLQPKWSAAMQELDGELVMRILRPLDADGDGTGPEAGLYSLVRISFDDEGRIATVRDYLHAPPYLFESAARELGLEAAPFHWSHIPNPAQPA